MTANKELETAVIHADVDGKTTKCGMPIVPGVLSCGIGHGVHTTCKACAEPPKEERKSGEVCMYCNAHSSKCQPLWEQQRKCCPDCTHDGSVSQPEKTLPTEGEL